MVKRRTKMRKSLNFLLLFLPWVLCSCPEKASIEPCECQLENGRTSVSCQSLDVSTLKSVLTQGFCGQRIYKFYLREPGMDYLPSKLFLKNIVHEIQIEHANISNFVQDGQSAFYGQESCLESLSMRRCNFGEDLKWDKLSELRALIYLDLPYNKLTKVKKEWFHYPPPNLRSLILKENRIAFIEPGSFKYLHKLNELDLSSNNLEEIRRDIFPHPANELIFLRLNDNKLQSLPEDLFRDMFGLRRLYMDNNKIATLSENVWRPIWTDLEQLELFGNPIECSCDLRWIWNLRLPLQLYGDCNSCNGTVFESDCKEIKMIELRSLNIAHKDLWNC